VLDLSPALNLGAVRPSETSVIFYQTIRRHIPETLICISVLLVSLRILLYHTVRYFEEMGRGYLSQWTRRPQFISRQQQLFFSSPSRPDRFTNPPSLLGEEYRGPFPRDQRGGNMKLTTSGYLVLRLRMRGALSLCPSPSMPTSHGA
jgi:hypothetical protein